MDSEIITDLTFIDSGLRLTREHEGIDFRLEKGNEMELVYVDEPDNPAPRPGWYEVVDGNVSYSDFHDGSCRLTRFYKLRRMEPQPGE